MSKTVETMKLEGYTMEIYQDPSGNYRWRVIAQNGQNVGSANEGFSSKASCMNNAKSLAKALNQIK